MEKNSRIFIAGHRGMVGSAIVRALQEKGYTKLLLRERGQLDLCVQEQVQAFFAAHKPEYVFLAAAKVGGIVANHSYPAEFLYINAMIASNVIDAAHHSGVKKLLNLGSSCIYPREAPQPLREEYLLSGPLEPTNEAYALAKILAIRLCTSYQHQYGCNFLSAMPCNLYGPGDNFHPEHSHLLPALVRKMADAADTQSPEVTLWGDGSPRRELLYSQDLADASVFLMEHCNAEDLGDSGFINIGSGEDMEVRELAELVGRLVGYTGTIRWDTTRPNGTMRKLMDSSKIRAMGWAPRVSLEEGIPRLLRAYRSGQYREQ